ncbi:MAG: CoA ester lyase [Tenericutes bacterium]|nr:CoA ester lyase [Mycoplasmatota bacterium]
MFRSLLFIPGNNPSMIQNADVFNSDGIIFDLEDSVDINEKDNARNLVNNYLSSANNYPSLVVLRVNPIDTEFFKKDIELIKTKKINYILLPKTTMDALNVLEEMLYDIEVKFDLDTVKVIALVESAKSIIQIFKIAKHCRVEAILLGAEDLCNDLEIDRSNEGNEILFARSRVIYACASNNIISIDTPNTNIDDELLLREDCLNAKNLGMKAKSSIHPSQLEIINEVFSPSKKEIIWAKRVLEAVEKNIGKGAFSLDGKMIDKPIILKAQKIIQKANKYNME